MRVISPQYTHVAEVVETIGQWLRLLGEGIAYGIDSHTFIFVVASFIRYVRWLSLLQEKEYRWDRLKLLLFLHKASGN